MKRIIDIIGASLGLLAIAPLMPFIAISIKLNSRGPVMVKLDRVSGGKIFKAYKFRSMLDKSHAMKFGALEKLNERKDGPFFKIKNDPRITTVGKVLRKLRIDEFPQLINVLRGEMSLVGPRPHEPNEVIHYPPEYQHLILARSGVTGLSQTNGASGLPFLKELELDSDYVKNPSLWKDVKILAKTLKITFFDPTAV
ncbi:MAG: sugar transferase [Patescibacteria group bacterium]